LYCQILSASFKTKYFIELNYKKDFLAFMSFNMSKDKIQEDKSLYTDPQWGEVRSSILRQYVDTDKQILVNDQVLIQQQTELIE
jgi:hypothetical protein